MKKYPSSNPRERYAKAQKSRMRDRARSAQMNGSRKQKASPVVAVVKDEAVAALVS